VPHRFADRREQLGARRPLQQVGRSASPERLRRDVGILVHRDEDEPHRAIHLLDLPRGVEAVQQRHRQVEHHDVGMELADGFHERPSVGNASDDVTLRREQLLERLEQEGVVVGQDDAGLRHWGYLIRLRGA